MPLLTASHLARTGWTQRDDGTYRLDFPERSLCWLVAVENGIGWHVDYVRHGHHEPHGTAVLVEDLERIVSRALAGKL